MYTIKQMASMANISKRTLRYYDSIGLLKATRDSSSNYRYYTDEHVLLLQQILLFKQMDLPLLEIKHHLYDPSFDLLTSLHEHHTNILHQIERLSVLQKTITTTISQLKGGHFMSNEDTFKGLKEQAIENNEQMYGEELREQYGQEVMEQSYQKMRKMSPWQWQHAEQLGKDILSQLPLAMEHGIDSKEAQTVCHLHQEWIQLYWTSYSKEAHLGLCKMYTEDERFKAYYDRVQKGAAVFLYQAMQRFLK